MRDDDHKILGISINTPTWPRLIIALWAGCLSMMATAIYRAWESGLL